MNSTHHKNAHIELETLEDRAVPAAISMAHFDGQDILMIQGSSAADKVEVSYFYGWTKTVDTTHGTSIKYFRGVDRIFATLGEGNDKFINNTTIRSQVYGEGGTDFLTGGNGYDYLNGGSGTDYLDGRGGTDVLFGGSGNDYLDGGSGTDYLYGGSGYDRAWGGGTSHWDYLASDNEYRNHGEVSVELLVKPLRAAVDLGMIHAAPWSTNNVIVGDTSLNPLTL